MLKALAAWLSTAYCSNPEAVARRREDVLDLVTALRRPADYQARDSARFEIHFEKARGLYGEAAQPIEAKLETHHGVAQWTWRSLHLGDLERYAQMLEQGLNPLQIAQELGISKSRSYRLRDRISEMGKLVGDAS